MAEIESRLVHIRIEPEEAVENKKRLLEMEILMLEIMKKYYMFKKLDKEEGKYRQMIRRIVTEITHELNNMTEILPKLEEHAKPLLKVKRGALLGEESQAGAKSRIEEQKIEDELQEIKDRLAKL